METDFWLERWRNQQIGFHQSEINTHLESFWSQMEVSKGETVFVPLCGKSRDMLWLAGQGYRVIGVEISPIASAAFFAESGLLPSREHVGEFDIYHANGIEIRCGNFFDLEPSDLAHVRAVYDRASLVALPQEMRQRYADKLASLLPDRAQVMLITFDYPQEQMSGPPFSVSPAEVHQLYDHTFEMDLLASEEILAQNERFRHAGVTRMQEHVFRLSRRPRS